MRTTLLILTLLSVSLAHAQVTVSTDKVKISNDCLRVNAEGVSVKTGDCDNRGKGPQGNRSIHGGNNPGRGHDKYDKPGKKK
jgi:hypothetical protein